MRKVELKMNEKEKYEVIITTLNFLINNLFSNNF